MSGPFGPRASILRVGACEQLDEESWYLTGWLFNSRSDPRLTPGGCPYTHDDEGRHIGMLGWTFEELKALSDAEMELGRLERPPDGL